MGQVPEAASRCGEPPSQNGKQTAGDLRARTYLLVAENPNPQEAIECATTQHGEMFRLKRLCAGGERILFQKF